MDIANSDILKVYDAIKQAYEHHYHKDMSNARTHAAVATRFAPLTSTLEAQKDRLEALFDEQGISYTE